MKKSKARRVFLLALAAILAGGGAAVWIHRSPDRTALAPMRFAGETLVIDAGHGGEDGGAVSVSGAVESQINLAIALRLDALMGLYGVNTLMLRSTDISLHDPDASTLRQKKVSDLHNRAAAIEELDDPVVISIHQNTYTDERFHGSQVFYANGQLSLPLAQLTQTALKEALDPENERQPTAVAENVYLMNHISCRAILVECGFLSNPEEDRLLQSSDYQLKLAAVLAGAYLSYQQIDQEGETSHVSESQDDFLLYGMRQ
jgi:N-acetylmuramoyl-L-alanine amidase